MPLQHESRNKQSKTRSRHRAVR